MLVYKRVMDSKLEHGMIIDVHVFFWDDFLEDMFKICSTLYSMIHIMRYVTLRYNPWMPKVQQEHHSM